MDKLADRSCVPCDGDFPALAREQAESFMEHIPGWNLSGDATGISREYRFKDFADALAFTNAVGALAEEEGHHPDIALSWGKVGVSLTTHAIGGLSENDIILAAKIDLLPK
ncbi:MAG TPA: 4a-hydroxytetrahydrobiopterin dehydratase [Candidatus Paceibacterota bacterium]|nr:4a-hydroxytetrahydrobiopterin dehydratase [Candidatus Paceibacterota bacterium]